MQNLKENKPWAHKVGGAAGSGSVFLVAACAGADSWMAAGRQRLRVPDWEAQRFSRERLPLKKPLPNVHTQGTVESKIKL